MNIVSFLYLPEVRKIEVSRLSSYMFGSFRKQPTLRFHTNIAECHSPIASIRFPRRCHTIVLYVGRRCAL